MCSLSLNHTEIQISVLVGKVLCFVCHTSAPMNIIQAGNPIMFTPQPIWQNLFLCDLNVAVTQSAKQLITIHLLFELGGGNSISGWNFIFITHWLRFTQRQWVSAYEAHPSPAANVAIQLLKYYADVL